MKKDIDWLKKEVNKINGFKFTRGIGEYRMIEKQDVLELINQVEENEFDYDYEVMKKADKAYKDGYQKGQEHADISKQFNAEFNSVLQSLPIPAGQLIEEFRRFVASNGYSINHADTSEEKDTIEPEHYLINGKDLFDEWHERYYNSEKLYTGREVFVAIMKAVAERYSRRYPNKNEDDLAKSIYTLTRLLDYEENTNE